MAVDPTTEQIATFTSVDDVATWAGLAQEVRAAVYKELGATGTEHYRLVAMISEKELEDIAEALKISGADVEQELPASRIQKAAIKLFGRASRVASGMERTMEQSRLDSLLVEQARAKAAPPGPPEATSGQSETTKISQVMDQASETIVPIVGKDVVDKFYAAYRLVFGATKSPPEHKDLTTEQLSAFFHRLHNDINPYCDFSVWKPFGNRVQRKMKNKGLQLKEDGTIFHTVEFYGPADFQTWSASFDVLLTAHVGFQSVSLGGLVEYHGLIKTFHERFGAACWWVIYQGDVRNRLEHMVRLKRDLTEEENRDMPWTHVWRKSVVDSTFWKREVEDPCVLILARAGKLSDMVDGDAPVSAPLDETVPAEACSRPPPKRSWGGSGEGSRPTKVAKGPKQHNVVNGEFTTNRNGWGLCKDFQTGNCRNSGNCYCPKNRSLAHQCSRCLALDHGSGHPSPCTATPKESSAVKRASGKGGKGKGRKGKS